MKFIVSIILTALLSFVAVSVFQLPWWSLALAAFLVSVSIHQVWWKSSISGFLGVFILWAALAWWIDIENGGILSSKVAEILFLGGSSILLIIVSAFIGGLVAGFAAMSGSFLRENAGRKSLSQ